MADSISRAPWDSWRRGRGPPSSRVSSARSSTFLDDNLHPSAYPGSQPHGLRPMESRFSLNEHFAATRRDFEFDDAASSIWERSTTAEGEVEQDDILVVPKQRQPAGLVVRRSHYELFCLSEGAELKPEEIRRAYLRMVQVLSPDRQPQHLVPMAQKLMDDVQVAFETLIEPYRRVGYDMAYQQGRSEPGEEEEDDDEEENSTISADEQYEHTLNKAYQSLSQRKLVSSTDIGLRLDARQRGIRGKRRTLEPLDLHVQQAMTLALPTFRIGPSGSHGEVSTGKEPGVHDENLLSVTGGSAIFVVPSVMVTGGMHGFIEDPNRQVSLQQDIYQLPGPSIHGQRHLEQLAASRVLPIFNVNLRQELYKESRPEPTNQPSLVLEQKLCLLPEPAVTARFGYPVRLPSGKPLNVEICLQKLASETRPIVGLALHKQVAKGTGFLRIDAGDWTLRPAEECNNFSKFSRVTKGFSQARNPFRNAPTVEVGYTVSPYQIGLCHGRSLTKPAVHRISTMDGESSTGSWTVSVGGTADTLASYLRYTRNILSTLQTEVELCATGTAHSLSFRTLKRLTSLLTIGFEVNLSPTNLHLSLYLSHAQTNRLSIPLLITSTPNPSLRFWATLLSFLSLAAPSFLPLKPQHPPRKQPKSKDELASYIAHRRTEAHTLTVLLSSGAEPRQRLEKQKSGLIILSAKYSVPDAPSDEVADVTVAVAALVDGGSLKIPKGLRKGRLLGFWDPAPGEKKVLTVRWLLDGKEGEGRWVGREEVCIGRG